VAGLNICNTLNNVFNIAYLAMGNAVAIIVGQMLGAGEMEQAKDTDTKLIFFSTVLYVCIGGILAIVAPFFPRLYNTTPEVQRLATRFLWVLAFTMPFCAFTNAAYFTLRSGGRTGITFAFDSVFMWCFAVPLALILSRFTSIPVVPMYMLVQGTELIKAVIGYLLVKQGAWMQNLVEEQL
jgi:Na+-driven multidrug efflux pump